MMFSEGFYQFRQFYFVIVTNYRELSYVIGSYGMFFLNIDLQLSVYTIRLYDLFFSIYAWTIKIFDRGCYYSQSEQILFARE